MAQSFFIWNGIDCRSKGVILRGPAAIIRAEERVNHVEIPGTAGDLTQLEGENIFNSYIQTVSISVKGGYNVRNIYKWLRGSGYVTFSGEPEVKQAARVIGAITLNRVSRNIDHWAGEVQFYCQPFKELLRETVTEVTASGTAVRNSGDVTERPVIKVTPSGSTAVISAGGKTLTIQQLTSGTDIWVDCQIMDIFNSDRSASLLKGATGEFPQLAVGANTVTGSGWSRLEIHRRERFL
jgi:phage-related protein